jgi:hypothetical protein
VPSPKRESRLNPGSASPGRHIILKEENPTRVNHIQNEPHGSCPELCTRCEEKNGSNQAGWQYLLKER